MSFAKHTSRFGAGALLISASLALGSACSEELDSPSLEAELEVRDDAISGDVASKTVHPNRAATLTLRSGATLHIPGGAVTKPSEVRFERPRQRLARELIDALEDRDPFTEQFEAASAPYILTPYDTNLQTDVRVSLPVATRARDERLAVLWLENETSRSWKVIDTAAVRGNRVTFPLRYFGVVIVAKRKPPTMVVDGGVYDAGDAQILPDAELPADASSPDAGQDDAGQPSCGTNQPGTFFARVVDATTTTTPIAGVTVVVLDDATGLPVAPSIQDISDSDGCVQLPIGSLSSFGIKALGNSNYTDTFTYHYRADNVEPVVRMGGNAIAVVLPALASFEARPDRAPVVGAVNWRTSDLPFYDVIGCAQIEDDAGDITAQDLRYFAATLPSSPTEWPLENGTNPQNGRFYIGNMLPGPHTLTARLPDGSVLGSSTLVVFPRSSSSTQVNGAGQNLFFGGIFIDAPPGTPKPGCAP